MPGYTLFRAADTTSWTTTKRNCLSEEVWRTHHTVRVWGVGGRDGAVRWEKIWNVYFDCRFKVCQEELKLCRSQLQESQQKLICANEVALVGQEKIQKLERRLIFVMKVGAWLADQYDLWWWWCVIGKRWLCQCAQLLQTGFWSRWAHEGTTGWGSTMEPPLVDTFGTSSKCPD